MNAAVSCFTQQIGAATALGWSKLNSSDNRGEDWGMKQKCGKIIKYNERHLLEIKLILEK